MGSAVPGATFAMLPAQPQQVVALDLCSPSPIAAPLHAVCDRMLALVVRALGVDGAAVALDGDESLRMTAAADGGRDDRAALRLLARHVAATGKPLALPEIGRLPQAAGCTGDVRVVAYAATPLIAPDGRVLGALAGYATTPRVWSPAEVEVLADIAALAAARIALDERGFGDVARDRARHQALLDIGGAGVIEIDLDGRCTLVNGAADALLGYGDTLIGRDIHLFLHTRWDGSPQHDFEHCPITTVLRAGLRLGPEETAFQCSDGSRFYAEYASAPVIEDGRVTGAVLWFRDLTPRKQLEERLAQQAQCDSLTGLANRLVFAERLDEALARAAEEDGTVAVLMIDLDDFSAINLRYSNTAGDRLLIEVGRRLSTCVRHGDLVARSGGDEFAVLLERVAGVGEAQRVVERLLAGLRPPFPLAGDTVQIAASAGIAVMEGYCAADDLLRAAAAALAEAKRAGKGCAVIAEAGTPLVLG